MSTTMEPSVVAGDVNRKKAIRSNAAGLLVLRGISMASSYFIVPILISYLDVYKYGIWITIYSIVNFIQFFDIGLGNGLRNKYAHSIAIGDTGLARVYVSTTYYLITIISGGLLLLFGGIYFFVDWHKAFNVNQSVGFELNWLVILLFGTFILSFPLKLINSLLYGAQKSALANSMTAVGNIVSLLMVVLLLKKNGVDNLLYVGVIYTVAPLVLFLFLNIYYFSTEFKHVIPARKFVDTRYIKDLTGLGVKFFILQINSLIIFSSNSFIIAQTLGQVKVTEYNVMFKLYSVPSLIFQILLTPYWSAFTSAYAKNDITWIKKNLKHLLKIFGGIIVVSVLLVVFNKFLFHMWVGNRVSINTMSGIWMVAYLIVQSSMLPFVNFINGTGKIKLQLYLACVVSLVNIPLSIYFIKSQGWGIDGCIIANIICTIPFLILMGIQTLKIINNKAVGIWND